MADLEDVTIGNGDEIDNLLKMEEMTGELPSSQRLLEMLESADFSDDVKESLRSMLNGGRSQVMGGGGAWMAVMFASIIFSVILFFSYKLYKSIKEKEKKKEEKKKAKLQKKKK